MPEQNHIHDHFQSFQEEANTVQKMSASEIRQLGNRRRTHRRLGIASGIAAATVVAVGAVAMNLGAFNTSRIDIAGTPSGSATSTGATPTPTAAPTPTPSRPASTVNPTPTGPASTTFPKSTSPASSDQPPTVDWTNVPAVAQMFPLDPSLGRQLEQYEGLGQTALGQCDPGDPRLALQDANEPVTILTRTFNWVGGEDDTVVGRTARVIELSSAESATRVYNLYLDMARNCPARFQNSTEFTTPRVYDPGSELPFDGSGATQPARAAYLSMILIRQNSDVGMFNETMVVQSGNRVMLLTATFNGMDHNCGVEPQNQCDFPRMLDKFLAILDQ